MQPTLIKEPDDDTILWRYLTFKKFESVVTSRGLYFARLDTLGDSHEGYFPASMGDCGFAGTRYAWAWRFLTYASCWHSSDHESVAMWSNYVHGEPGVVLRVQARNLKRFSRLMVPNSSIGSMIYDPIRSPVTLAEYRTLPYRKRVEFASEAEVRVVHENIDGAIIDDFVQLGEEVPQHWPRGTTFSFDGIDLISEIRTSPSAPEDFCERVARLVERSDLAVPVNPSSIAAHPDWPMV